MEGFVKAYRRDVKYQISEDFSQVTILVYSLGELQYTQQFTLSINEDGEVSDKEMFDKMFDLMTLRVRRALASKLNAIIKEEKYFVDGSYEKDQEALAKAVEYVKERQAKREGTDILTEEEPTVKEQIQVSAYRRPYTVTIETNQDGDGTAKFLWQDGIYAERTSAPIRNGKVDLSYCVTIAMKSRKVLQERINEHLASAQEEAQEVAEEEPTQTRTTLVVNDKVFEFIHNEGATQILVKPQDEESFFIRSPHSKVDEESLERIGLDYLKKELLTFDIITTQDNGDGVEVLRHDTDSRVVGQQFDLESFMMQMLKNRQVDSLTVRPIRNGLAGKKTVYGVTYDISIVQVGRVAYAIRLQTQNKDIQEAYFIEEDLEDGVRVYRTFDMFGNYSGTAELDKEYQLVDYYHE